MDLARIRAKVAHDPAVVERLNQAGKRLNEGIALKRRVIETLRPSALSTLGLAASLHILCAETSDGLGIPVHADIAELSAGADLDLTIYRVVQESLTNVSKYAAASAVQVKLSAIDDGVRLAVSDDGKGFDVDQSLVGRHGIAGIRFRVTSLGGTLTLTSSPGCGTALLATFPLPDHTERAALLQD
jgi:signal transduction histidine kinase